MAFPAALDSFTSPSGTSLLTSPDHANLHASAGSAIVNIETNIGTNSGTSVLKNFVVNDFAVRINSSNVLQQPLTGTLGMSAGTISGQITNSGTIANGVYGTAQITGGTATGMILLQQQSGCSVYLSGSQSLTNGVTTKVTFDTKLYDLGTEFGTAASRFTAGSAGKYLVTYNPVLSAIEANQGLSGIIYKNGTVLYQQISIIGTNNAQQFGVTTTAILNLAATDFLEFYAVQAGTQAHALLAGSMNSYAMIQRIV